MRSALLVLLLLLAGCASAPPLPEWQRGVSRDYPCPEHLVLVCDARFRNSCECAYVRG